jgi:hypothetical protein
LFMTFLRLPLFLLALPLLSLAQQPDRLIIDSGTEVFVRLNWNLSWANARVGDRVPLEVLQDVLVKNRNGSRYLVISRGEMTVGTVTDIEQDKHLGRGDTLAVTLGSIKLADGEVIAVHPLVNQPYFLGMNVKERTLYPAGYAQSIGTFGVADVEADKFEIRP